MVVTILIFTELKESFGEMSKQFDKYEFLTLGKFLVIAGVILPIIPDQQFVSFINITPYRVWLAVVVISTISYISYLLKKFVFKDSGIIISGILGGLYSSTATTIILSKKSRTSSCHENQYAGAIILATCMMYIRILILLFIFNKQLFLNLFLSLLILAVISAVVALIIIRKKPLKKIEKDNIEADKNPLEFKVALLFTALYVAFSFVTWYAVENFGENGLTILSFIVGVTDIDPFLINIFQGKYNVSESILTLATIQAIISNNVVKVVYATFVSSKKVIKPVLIGFAVIIAANIIIEFFL